LSGFPLALGYRLDAAPVNLGKICGVVQREGDDDGGEPVIGEDRLEDGPKRGGATGNGKGFIEKAV
jgi:hypothetical protein